MIMGYSVTNVKQVGGNRIVEVFLEDVSDLASLPQIPGENWGMGSVAYTSDFNIWFLTSNGWEASA